MPSLRELADNLPNFNYYSGPGNFTQNKIGYGDNKPLVVVPPGFRWSPSNIDEGFLQFGAVTVASRTGADVLRISKFLTTTPQGPLFVLKQLGLQRTNPKIEFEGEDQLSRRGKEKFGPTREYTPLPLLAQVAGNAIGARFKRHGVLPEISDTSQYESYILQKDSENKNRLVTLAKELSDSSNVGQSGDRQNYILEYKSGPQSFYGIGDTRIRRVGYSLLFEPLVNNNGFVQIPVSSLVSINNDNQINLQPNQNLPQSPNTIGNAITGLYQFGENLDYRQFKNDVIRRFGTGDPLPSTDYTRYNMQSRIGISRARPDLISRVSYEDMTPGTHDKVNALSLYTSTAADPTGQVIYDFNGRKVVYNPNNEVGVRDLIKFRIKSIDNDKPTQGVYTVFRAYINNIRRTVLPKWNPYTYIGRGESFYLYDGFTETISVSFTIAASSRYEMKPLYQKLNYLISTLTPDYKNNKMRGNISELTIGNFVLYQPGVITNLDMTIDEDSNWEIAIDEYENEKDKDMHELPQLIKCTLSFIPIYNFLPKKSETQSPFIGIDYFPGIKEGQKWLQKVEPKKKGYKLIVDDPQKTDPYGVLVGSDFSYKREGE